MGENWSFMLWWFILLCFTENSYVLKIHSFLFSLLNPCVSRNAADSDHSLISVLVLVSVWPGWFEKDN